MKFRKFGKTVLTAAFSAAIAFSLSSCIRSFTSGYLYVTGTVTATPSGNGIISGFKIDNNTGKLNTMHGLPVSSGGANPVRIVLPTGGRFVYVLNKGTNSSGGSVCTVADPCQNANITQFVIGGNGILTPQETFTTQGINPFRLVPDASGLFLFALDHDAPSNTYCSAVISGATSCGDITVFAINQSTGRLTLVVNSVLTSTFGTNVTYFPVPANPIDFVLASSNMMTLSGAAGSPQSVWPYLYNAGSGQLTVETNTPQAITNGSGSLMEAGTAIVYAAAKIYILDNEPITVSSSGTTTTSPSQILPYTIGNNGALNSLTGGAVPGDPTLSSPIYLIVESKGKFLYVANQLGASTATGAGISGYFISPQDAELSVDPGSPWGTGAGPQCLLEDPSNQYIYTANSTDSTITGRKLDANSGELKSAVGGGGTFPLNGPATWCVTTGRTN